MLLALALIGGGVLGLRALVRRSEGKTGALAKSAAGYPKIRTDPGINPNVPCSGNPPPPAGMAYWGSSVTPAQQQWAVRALHTYPTGTIVEDIVDGKPIAARVEWHSWTTDAQGNHISGCYKGVSLLRYTASAPATHTGATTLKELGPRTDPPTRDQIAGEMLAHAICGAGGMPVIVGPTGGGLPVWGPWPGRWDRFGPRHTIALPPDWPPL